MKTIHQLTDYIVHAFDCRKTRKAGTHYDSYYTCTYPFSLGQLLPIQITAVYTSFYSYIHCVLIKHIYTFELVKWALGKPCPYSTPSGFIIDHKTVIAEHLGTGHPISR